jgi:ribosomal protein S18 acetylase RimI-like enzyme
VATQGVEVVPLADDLVEAAGAALARAFQDEPILVYMLPDPTERARRAPLFFAQALRYTQLVGAAYAPAGTPTGAALGWPIPTNEPTPEQATMAGLQPLSEVLGEAAYARFAALATHIEEEQTQLVPPPCWYLASLGVEPASQGKGIGRSLVQAFLARAATDEVPLCLWTNRPGNVGFYTALGLEVIREGAVPNSDLPYWIFRLNPV